MPLVLCNTVYAISESEVQAAVDSQGKDAVAGNIFIWFLCAVAFLKISQKIDSFMSGLGVNVGHTGGSMMAEAMIIARSLGVGGKGLLNKGFGSGGSSGAGSSSEKGGILSGGLAGVVGRSFNNSAMNAATDKGGGLFGKKAFESSLKSGGDLAKDVIGKVAKGDIAKTGSITGETADKALSAYLGFDGGSVMPDTDIADSSAIPTEIGGIEESADSGINPVEASSGPEIGTPPETSAVPDIHGTGVPSVPERAVEGDTATAAHEDIPTEGVQDMAQGSEMPEMPEVSDIGYSSDMNTDIGAQAETDLTDSEQPDVATAGTDMGVQPETNIPLSHDTPETGVSSSSIPSTAASENMPELPEISPDYNNMEGSGTSAAVMPDSQSGISASAPDVEATTVSDSTQAVSGGDIGQSDTDGMTVQPAIVGDTDGMTVQSAISDSTEKITATPTADTSTTGIPQSETPQQSSANTATVQSGAAPVAVTQPVTGVSASNSQTQSNTVSNTANTSAEVNTNASVTQQDHINNPVSMPSDSSVTVPASSGNENTGSMPPLTSGNGLEQNSASIPVFSNVEIGGGRIMGMETSDKFPNGVEFGMYNTAQYMKPEGEFTIVKTVDGAKWYKQYAAPKVERTPIVEENGKIKYEEKIIKKLPPVPRRKDKV